MLTASRVPPSLSLSSANSMLVPDPREKELPLFGHLVESQWHK
jgi:hypothetical protein